MATKMETVIKEITETPLQKMQREKKELAQRMLAEAKSAPEVIELAEIMYKRTIKWAEKAKIVVTGVKEATTQGKDIVKLLETEYENGYFNSNQMTLLLKLSGILLGEKLSSRSIESGRTSSGVAFDSKIVILQTNKTNDNEYPLNEPIFILDGDSLRGYLSSGFSPQSGFFIDNDPACLSVPTKEQFLDGLAMLYAENTDLFIKFAEGL